ncbi:MAG: glycosyltransferase family 39 protein [Ardenticatenaceae bacterium]|nr:glycosyltransferase family 39 protein [Ardenticatenaceae bacterium]MCB9443241.1 glycosyltransferase family 39 protein [Ardenticatenaceae bacterium]
MHSTDSVLVRRRLGGWLLVLLTAWGIWLWNLNLSELSFDESATYFVANRPPLEILHYLLGAAHEHPPVYYLLIRGWMALAGTGEFALRYFSLLMGTVALALIGWLARLVARSAQSGLLLGLVTAVLLTFTPAMVFYVRNARMYSLVIVWSILSAGLLWRDWVSTDKRPCWTAVLALMLVNGLSLFTHYYLILLVAAQPLILLAVRRWRPLSVWMAMHSIPALAGGVWLLLATGLQNTLANVLAEFSHLSLPSTNHVVLFLSALAASPLTRTPLWKMWVLLVLLVGGVTLAWRIQAHRGIWLLLSLVTPFVLTYVLPREPQARYLIYLLPLAALTIAHTITLPAMFAKRRGRGIGLSLALLLPAVWMLSDIGLGLVLNNNGSHYGQALRTVQANARPGDQALFYGPWQLIPFQYYNPGQLPPITVLPKRVPPVLDAAQAEPVLANLMAQAGRLWVVPMAVDAADPDYFVWQWLREHAHPVWWLDELQLFVPALPIDAPIEQLDMAFADDLVLEQVVHDPLPVAAGDALRLTLIWQGLRPFPDGIEAALTLVDESSRQWQSADFRLDVGEEQGLIKVYWGMIIPQGAPPGTYRVQLRLVDRTTNVSLRTSDEETVTLLSIAVTEPALPAVLSNIAGATNIDICASGGGTCVKLVGIEPGGVDFQPGYPLPLTLHWQGQPPDLPDLKLRLQIVSDPWLPGVSHTPILTQTTTLTPNYTSSNWPPGRLVTMPYILDLPPDINPGRAQVALSVIDGNGRFWATTDGQETVNLFPVVIEERPTLRRLPAGLERLSVNFGDEVGLRGYRVNGSVCPGEQIQVDYAWYAAKRPSAIYAAFNHLVTTDEVAVAQVDGWPQGGRLLTTQWQPGEYIEDSFVLDIPADVVPGPYTLYVGLYNAATGDRLPAVQNNERLPSDRVPLTVLTCE